MLVFWPFILLLVFYKVLINFSPCYLVYNEQNKKGELNIFRFIKLNVEVVSERLCAL